MKRVEPPRRRAPENPFVEGCKAGGGLNESFSNPSGRRGALAGIVMAFKNARMNQLAIEALDVWPGDCILEIGFGHGDTIAHLAGRAWAGYVAGVDTSEVMVRQARRRNRVAVREGRVALHRAGVSRLPFPSSRFDKVVASNCFQFWPAPLDDLREVRRVLRRGGSLLLVLRMKHPWRRRLVAPGFDESEIVRVCELVREAGFTGVQTETRRAGRTVTLLGARA